MPGEAFYRKRLLRRTWKETASFWTVYRYWVAVAPPLVATLLLACRRGLRSLMNGEDVVLNAGVYLVFTLAGTVVISFVRSLKLLDDDWQIEVAGRESQIDSLRAIISADPLEESRVKHVETELAKLDDQAKTILAYILVKGTVDHLDDVVSRDLSAVNSANKLWYANLIVAAKASGAYSVNSDLLSAITTALKRQQFL